MKNRLKKQQKALNELDDYMILVQMAAIINRELSRRTKLMEELKKLKAARPRRKKAKCS